MHARVKWVENVCFVGESETGHAIVIDGAPESGGRNLGMRPMELLLIGMGSCTAFDVVTILKKARQDVTGCFAELTAERAPEPPQVFTKLHLHFIITGRGLKENQVKRAVELSAEKYCSASIMLSRSGAEVTHSHEVREAE